MKSTTKEKRNIAVGLALSKSEKIRYDELKSEFNTSGAELITALFELLNDPHNKAEVTNILSIRAKNKATTIIKQRKNTINEEYELMQEFNNEIAREKQARIAKQEAEYPELKGWF